MAGFATRWVVREEFAVEAGDVEGGVARTDAVARWVTDACRAYVEQCTVLAERQARDGLELRTTLGPLPDDFTIGDVPTVVVSASATEVHPQSFTISTRVRATAEDALHAKCEVALVDPTTGDAVELGNDVRDALIALEHAAHHVN
jgi:hypothetical protein